MAFQEFMIAPVGAKNFADAVRMGSETYQSLKVIIGKKFGQAGMYRRRHSLQSKKYELIWFSDECGRRRWIFTSHLQTTRGS